MRACGGAAFLSRHVRRARGAPMARFTTAGDVAVCDDDDEPACSLRATDNEVEEDEGGD